MMLFDKLALFEEIVDHIGPKVSLETFFEAVGEGVDEIIMRETQRNGTNFLGGKTFFSLTPDEQQIIIQIEAYYMDAIGQPSKQEFSGKHFFSNLNFQAQNQFLDMLDENGFVTMEIEDPL